MLAGQFSSLLYSPPSLTETTCLLLTYVLNLGVNAVDHTIPSNNTGLTLNAYVCSCSTPSFSNPANSAIPKYVESARSVHRPYGAVPRRTESDVSINRVLISLATYYVVFNRDVPCYYAVLQCAETCRMIGLGKQSYIIAIIGLLGLRHKFTIRVDVQRRTRPYVFLRCVSAPRCITKFH